MRRVAQPMSVGVMGVFIYAVLSSGLPGHSGMDLLFWYALVVTPLVNICALTWQQPRGWLGLWFLRKQFEEERRIEQLRKGGDTAK
jgi:hypothetical protein